MLITKSKALELLKAKIEGKEEYVDPKTLDVPGPCQYAPEDEYPGCLVGQILIDLGVTNDQLVTMDGLGDVDTVVQEGAFPVDITINGQAVLKGAQALQDRGNTWGDALANAETIADLMGDAE